METIGLRYFNIFGPRQDPEGPYAAVIPSFIRDLKNKTAPVIYGDGSQTRDFTFIENAVHANIRALFTENQHALNQVFNIAAGEPYTILHLFEIIKGLMGENFSARFEPARKGDIMHSFADISKAKDLLQFQPEIKLKEGLHKLLITCKTSEM